MKKIIASTLIFSLLAVGIALATDPITTKIAEIDTYFTNDGPISAFHETTWINWGSEGITEKIVATNGDLTVIKNADFYDNYIPCDTHFNSLNEDKVIIYGSEPEDDVFIAKDVWWGNNQANMGAADIYREAYFSDKADITHAGGIGEGYFMDRIQTDRDIFVYQSVGLNQFATCEYPTTPTPLTPPTCTWCIDP